MIFGTPFPWRINTTKRTNSTTLTHDEWYLLGVRKKWGGMSECSFQCTRSQVNLVWKEFGDFFLFLEHQRFLWKLYPELIFLSSGIHFTSLLLRIWSSSAQKNISFPLLVWSLTSIELFILCDLILSKSWSYCAINKFTLSKTYLLGKKKKISSAFICVEIIQNSSQ